MIIVILSLRHTKVLVAVDRFLQFYYLYKVVLEHKKGQFCYVRMKNKKKNQVTLRKSMFDLT
jgi:hypothetical protein